ncbi:ferritin-like domain-containing protein [Chitinophaga qingshengii]|uniref:PA2169 family four-helix-bundle protein n=1 Tax=Chitinophaga qingshengii TaxID=1569794 RepID=A0ABR7TNH8_9BACT|nr:PA2169 family four-helix-bundle protein [Chitinophaga qingshengii]MBC9931548.1 PA2169 family four-helix-bundle protein [Chitinophaga qingshengii]
MQQQEVLAEVISDLVKINNDRVEGYQQAIDATDDIDLKALFQRMIDDSRRYASQLYDELVALGEQRHFGTTAAGKLYRAWMEVKTVFTGHDRHAILSFCEYGEDAAQSAYSAALKVNVTMPYRIRELIADQQKALRNDHDIIKTYRDMQKVVY